MRWIPIVFLLTACAGLEYEATSQSTARDGVPRSSPGQGQTFQVELFVNPDYDASGGAPERERLRQVKHQVEASGKCPGGYDIINRQVVKDGGDAAGKTYSIIYTVRCD